MIDEYVVGDPKPQRWVQKGLSAYMRLDGSVGYEFSDGRVLLRLDIGDVLTNNDGKIRRR